MKIKIKNQSAPKQKIKIYSSAHPQTGPGIGANSPVKNKITRSPAAIRLVGDNKNYA